MTALVLAALTFSGLHLLVSGTRLRDVLAGRFGENGYRGLFSLASALALGWLIWTYGRSSTPEVTPWIAYRWLAAVLMAPAVALVVLGLLTPGPTQVGLERRLETGEPARGVHRITRHPFLWGVALWALVHMAFNAGTPHWVFFGTFLLVAAAGTFSIDAKRARRFGAHWQRYAGETSNLPFAAVLEGRNRVRMEEIGLVRLLAVIAAYAAVALLHSRLFGVAPF